MAYFDGFRLDISPSRPAFLEADAVAHCGESLSGIFAYTIDCVDIATGWTEQRAAWRKGESDALDQIKDIEFLFALPPCSDWIVATDPNSPITTSSNILPKENNPPS